MKFDVVKLGSAFYLRDNTHNIFIPSDNKVGHELSRKISLDIAEHCDLCELCTRPSRISIVDGSVIENSQEVVNAHVCPNLAGVTIDIDQE